MVTSVSVHFGPKTELDIQFGPWSLRSFFIRGVHNLAADSLSRAFESMSEEQKEIFRPQTTKEDFIFQCKTAAADQEKSADRELLVDSGHQSVPSTAAGSVNALRRRKASPAEAASARPASPLLADDAMSSEKLDDQSDNENFVDFIPAISETDYMNDSEFAGIFHYLSTGELMNDEKVDKKTLLLSLIHI